MTLNSVTLTGAIKGDTGPTGGMPVPQVLTTTVTLTGQSAYTGDVPVGGLIINPGTPTDTTILHRAWIRWRVRGNSGAVKINLPQCIPTEFVPTTGLMSVQVLHAIWIVDSWYVVHLSGGTRYEHWMASYSDFAYVPVLVVAGATTTERATALGLVAGWGNSTRKTAMQNAGVTVQFAVPSVGDISKTPGGRYAGVSGNQAYVSASKSILLSTSATTTERDTAFNAAATALGI
jgi:hypothetical protein